MSVIPSARKCARRDCDRPARPNGWFCSDACRARTWKERNPDYVPPPGQTARQNAAERPRRASVGGLQVSVGRMLQVLQETPWVLPEVQARRAVSRALSERQRELFERRFVA